MKRKKCKPEPPIEAPRCSPTIEGLIDLIEEVKRELLKEIHNMAQNIQDLQDAITAQGVEIDGLKTSVDALIAQGSTPVDTTPLVGAVVANTAKVTALKAEVDAAITPA